METKKIEQFVGTVMFLIPIVLIIFNYWKVAAILTYIYFYSIVGTMYNELVKGGSNVSVRKKR